MKNKLYTDYFSQNLSNCNFFCYLKLLLLYIRLVLDFDTTENIKPNTIAAVKPPAPFCIPPIIAEIGRAHV